MSSNESEDSVEGRLGIISLETSRINTEMVQCCRTRPEDQKQECRGGQISADRRCIYVGVK